MTRVISLLLIGALAGCGGGHRKQSTPSRYYGGMASGPISKACMASDRKARSPQLCSCIQSAANAKLTGAEQRRAAQFYNDPHLAQETRQSSRASDERFWRTYKEYASLAESMCS